MPLAHVHTPTRFLDTATHIDRGTHIETSTGARFRCKTSSTSIVVNARNDIYPAFPQFAEIGLTVDGAYNQSVPLLSTGATTSPPITLNSNMKMLDLTNGLQSKPGGGLIGSYLVSLEGNAPIYPLTERFVFAGDSITVEANAAPPSRRGHAMLLRQAGYDVALDGWGYNTYSEIAGDETKRAAFVARIKALNPTILWLALGTNDYALSAMTQAQCQAAVDLLLIALNAEMPALKIKVQTPLLRSIESANSLGVTAGNIRTAITDGTAGKSYAVLVDGTTILALSDLADGVHPHDAGHAKYAQFIATLLGLNLTPFGPVAAPDALTNHLNTTLTLLGPKNYRVVKNAGGGDWNASAGSPLYAGDFRHKVTASGGFDIMVGVSTNPAASAHYNTINYAMYMYGSFALREYLLGVYGADLGGYAIGDALWIDRTGSTLVFKRGPSFSSATPLRTYSNVTAPLGFDCSIHGQTQQFDVLLS